MTKKCRHYIFWLFTILIIWPTTAIASSLAQVEPINEPSIPTILFEYDVFDDLVVVAPARIRTAPTTNSEVLGSAQPGDHFERRPLGTVEVDGVEWAPIRYNEQDAWIGLRYVNGQILAESPIQRESIVVPEHIISELEQDLPDDTAIYEVQDNALQALDSDGNVIALARFNVLAGGEVTGTWQEVSLFMTEMPDDISDDTLQRMAGLKPNGIVSIGLQTGRDSEYIWGYGVDGEIRSLWNMTPDGGEWAELRIDSPNRETMANPEVFDQIPERIKQSYLYSEDLGGYFRVQHQRDGQNAIEVFMPRLVGQYDPSTRTTSEGWTRLYDSLPGGINFYGFGDFRNRDRAANYGGIVEGKDEELQVRYQAALTEMTNLMYEFSNGQLNPRLTPEEIQQRRAEGRESFELVIPNDWYMWRRNMDRTVEELTQQNPSAFRTQTFVPNGVNFIMMSDMSNEETARWMATISFIDRTNVGVSLGYSISENGRLNVFIFTMNEGGPAYSSISIDSTIPNALAKLVKHTQPNPPAQEMTGYAAHEPFKWAIANALGVGTSTANQEQLVRSGYSPLLDVSPSDNA